MEPSLISLIIDGVFGVFILFGFLFGLRGIKKATKSLVTFIVNIIVVLIITPMVSKLLLGIKIAGLSVYERIYNVAKQAVGEELAANNIVQEVIKNIPVLIADIVVAIVLLFLVGILIRIIAGIIGLIVHRKPKEKVVETVEMVDGEPQVVKKTVKEKKYRLAGGLVGAVHGLILVCAIILPLFGLVNIFNDLSGVSSASAATESSNNMQIKPMDELIQDYVPEEAFDYLKGVNNSVFFKLSKTASMSELALNFVSRCNINGHTIRLGNEIRTLASAYDNFVDFALSSTSELENYSPQTIFNDVVDNPGNYDFNKLDKSIDALFNSKIVLALGNDVMIFAVDTVNNQITDVETTKLLDHVSVALTNYSKARYDMKEDFKNLVSFFEVSANSGLIAEFKKPTIELAGIKTKLFNNDNRLLNQLTQKISNSNLLQKLILEGTNYGVERLETILNNNLVFDGTDHVSLKQIDSSKRYVITAEQLNDIVVTGIDGYEAIEGLDFNAISNDFYVIFDGDVVELTKSVGELVASITDLSMLKDTGVFDSVCDSLAKTKYSEYVSFDELKNGRNISGQFNLLSQSIKELVDSGVIASIRDTAVTGSEKTNAIIDKLAEVVEEKTRANRILVPILNCNVFKNTVIYGMNYLHDELESGLKSLNENAEISKFNTSNILTNAENQKLLSMVDNMVTFLKDVDIGALGADDVVETIVNSDLSLLGNALDSLKSTTLFSPSGQNLGAYVDILNALQETEFAKIFDFTIASDSDFVWNTELTRVSNLIDDLNDIQIDGENLVKYLMNGGDYDEVLDSLTDENVDKVKPMFEIEIIKPIAVQVINAINGTVKTFVGDEIGAGIEDVDNNADIKIQAQSIVNMIKNAIKIDFDSISLDTLDADKENFNALLDSIKENAVAEGVFEQTYNALLIKITNMINENIKTVVGAEKAGNRIVIINEYTEIIDDEENIRAILNKAIDTYGSFDNLDIKTLNVDDLFDFVALFDVETTVEGMLSNTHNALLVYCVNTINKKVYDGVGASLYGTLIEFTGNDDIGAYRASIKDVISSAHTIYSTLDDSQGIQDLSASNVDLLLTALSANVTTGSVNVFNRSYNAVLLKATNVINGKVKDVVGASTVGKNIVEYSSYVDVTADAQVIRNVITQALDNAETFSNLDIKTLNVQSLFNFIDAFNQTTTNHIFDETHNALLIYCVNTVNSRIYESVGSTLYGTLTSYNGDDNVRAYSNNIKNVISTASTIYSSLGTGEDIQDLSASNLDLLLGALSANVKTTSNVYVFNRSYNAILLKSVNTINEKVKDMVGSTKAGKNITLFTSYTDISSDGQAIRNLISDVFDSADSFNNIDMKTLNTNELFAFIDVFGNNTTIANAKFDATYNALLVYCVNNVNEQIKNSVGATYYPDYQEYTGDENMRTLRNNIKNIVDSAHDAYSALADGQNFEDLDQSTLNSLYTSLDSTTYTSASKTAIQNYVASRV